MIVFSSPSTLVATFRLQGLTQSRVHFRVSKKMVWLPMLGMFNVHTAVNACDCTRGPHWGIKPASVACRSDTLPTELHPSPIYSDISGCESIVYSTGSRSTPQPTPPNPISPTSGIQLKKSSKKRKAKERKTITRGLYTCVTRLTLINIARPLQKCMQVHRARGQSVEFRRRFVPCQFCQRLS